MNTHPSSVLNGATGWFLVFTGFFVPLSITATDLCMAATVILGVLSGQFQNHWNQLKHNPIVWCAVWIVALVALALIWSIAPWSDRLSALHKYAKLLYIPLLLGVCAHPKWRDRTIAAFLVGVVIVVILSYLKAWTGLHIGNNPNPAWVFYSHIETSFLVAFAAYLAALYAWKQPRRRIAWIALIVILSYQEFFINDGRTGWVAYLVLLLLFAIQTTGWKGLGLGLIGVAVLAGGLYYLSPTFQGIFKKSVSDIQQYQHGYEQTSLGYRLSFNSLSWQLAKQKPVLGYGAGSYATAAQQLGGVPGWKVVRTPHNEYLMMTVEFGVIGLLSLLLLFTVQWVVSFRLREMQYFAQGLLLVFMVSSFYNAFLYSSVSGHFYVLFTALFFAAAYPNAERDIKGS